MTIVRTASEDVLTFLASQFLSIFDNKLMEDIMKSRSRYVYDVMFRCIMVTISALMLSLYLIVGFSQAVDKVSDTQSSINTRLARYILKRIPVVLEDVRGAAAHNEKLRTILDRIRLIAPEESYYRMYPNAYALPVGNSNLILIEAPFFGNIMLGATFGTLYATGWTNADTLFQQACEAYRAAYKKSGQEPLFYAFDPDTYLGENTFFNKFFRKLNGNIFDTCLLWFTLHETGHHVLGHKGKVSDADSRIREEAADRWATATMEELGYSLFGIGYYFYGLKRLDECLTPLGLITPENRSTHPSYGSRYSKMVAQVDVGRAPKSRLFRTVYVPIESAAEIIENVYIHLPNSDSLTRQVVVQADRIRSGTTSISVGICEWRGNSVHIYLRSEGKKDRLEYIIPDISRAYNPMIMRDYNLSDNRVIGEATVKSFFFNSNMEHIKLVDDYTVADMRGDIESGEFGARHLRKVGAPETVIEKIRNAVREKGAAQAEILLAYGKGEISDATRDARLSSVYEKYNRFLELNLGKDRARRFSESLNNDPLLRMMEKVEAASGRELFEYSQELGASGF